LWVSLLPFTSVMFLLSLLLSTQMLLLITNVLVVHEFLFLLLLLFQMLLASLMHDVGFSTTADFPADSDGVLVL
jgi:hypothetical protein